MKHKKRMIVGLVLIAGLVSVSLIPGKDLGVSGKMTDKGRMNWTGTVDMTPPFPEFEVVSHNEPKTLTLKGVGKSVQYAIEVKSNFPTEDGNRRRIYFDMIGPTNDMTGYKKILRVGAAYSGPFNVLSNNLEPDGTKVSGGYRYVHNIEPWILRGGPQTETFYVGVSSNIAKDDATVYKYSPVRITLHMESTHDKNIQHTYELELSSITVRAK